MGNDGAVQNGVMGSLGTIMREYYVYTSAHAYTSHNKLLYFSLHFFSPSHHSKNHDPFSLVIRAAQQPKDIRLAPSNKECAS